MLNYTLYYLDSTLHCALSTIATDMHACYDNKCYCMHAMVCAAVTSVSVEYNLLKQSN